MTSPCDGCVRVFEAERRGEVKGWLAGLDHRNYCSEDETCPCFLVVEPKRKVPTEDADKPLIDLVEKK